VEAKASLDEWLAVAPEDTLGLLQIGKFQEQQLNNDEATRIYRHILDLDPDQLEARLRLATILLIRRHGEEAATELAVLREKLPNHPEVQVFWARAMALLGRTEEARLAIEECLRTNPDYPAALLEQGNNALFDGDEVGAEQYLARAAKLDPGNIQIHNKYALILSRNGKQAQATAEYAKAHQLEADGERISKIIRGPLQDNPNDPALHYEIGTIALRSGLVTEAIRWFTSALQVDPDHFPTHHVLANIYRELDNPVLAAKHHAIAQKLSLQQGKH
jgi:Flp pilus assembly protein TadD